MIPNTREQLLADTVSHYTEDLNRRCRKADGVSGCFYNPAKANKVGVSQGCAIGRFMTKAQKEAADELKRGSDIASVYSYDPTLIPKKLARLGIDFLADIQNLHDINDFWNIPRKRMSKEGREYIRRIIKKHKLDAKAYRAALKG
jgi:hypothetical protein